MRDSGRRARADADAPPDETSPLRLPFLLLHAGRWNPSDIAAPLAADGVEVREAPDPDQLHDADRPTVLVLDPDGLGRFTISVLARLVEAGFAIVLIGEPGVHDVPASIPPHLLSAYLVPPIGPRRLLIGIRSAFREAASRRIAREAAAETADLATEVTDLTEIGIRLLTERDLDALLGLILRHARRLTQADAGSLYLVEPGPDGGRRLRFKVIQNDSRPDLRLRSFTIPLDESSLAGHAALTGSRLVFDDVHDLPAGAPFSFNRSFDRRHRYRTRSMLVIPMASQGGETIGVLQLINRKPEAGMTFADAADVERHALPFDERAVALASALAGQAAVSIENSQLSQAIERLFDGFVSAAITAIEQRDPATSGHSERVASMTCALAIAADRADSGPFRAVRFGPAQIREIRYAGLLHDFGKVGVREQVLTKAKKLYPDALALIEQRHAFLLRSLEWREAEARAAHLEQYGRAGYDELVRRLEASGKGERDALARFVAAVRAANEPSVLPAGDFTELEALAARTYEAIDGTRLPFLTSAELESLRIRQGSLDETEWAEMRRHVSLTYSFLSAIPWTAELSGVPMIAHGHHEKLDGSGYPLGIAGGAIPLQSRLMTVADMFDALTAADRPYKRAIPRSRALDVLAQEVRAGRLDGDVLALFLEARIHEG